MKKKETQGKWYHQTKQQKRRILLFNSGDENNQNY